MLPGLIAVEGGGYRPEDLERITTTVSLTGAHALSGEIEYGDLLILFYGGSSITPAAPAGWGTVRIVGSSGWDAAHGVFHKIADGSEAGAILATGGNGSVVHVVRNQLPIPSIGVLATAGDISNGNPAALSVSSSGLSAPAIALGCSSTAWGTPNFYGPLTTPAFEREDVAGRIRAGIRIYTSGQALADQGADNLDDGSANGISAAIFEVN